MSRSYNKSYRRIFQAGSIAKKSDSFRKNPESRIIIEQASTEKKGTILIVDISGYSQSVKQADNIACANNTLDFQISEIEGDAILFYKYGAAQPVSKRKEKQ